MKAEILYPVTRTYLTRTLYLRRVTQFPTPLKKKKFELPLTLGKPKRFL